MSSSQSFQSLNQSRTSIHSIGMETNQSSPSTQIPSYCTLPRQSIGQTGTGSAFHPVAKSAPNTPKIDRSLTRMTSAPQSLRTDIQTGRSVSQPSSPTSAVVSQQNLMSVYSMKMDPASTVDPPVQVLPTRDRPILGTS